MCKYCKIPYSNKGNLNKHLQKRCIKRNELNFRLNSFKQELIIVNKKINEIGSINEYDVNEEDLNDDTYNKFDRQTLIKMIKAEKEKEKEKEIEIKSKSNTNNINNNKTNNINNVTNNIQINLNNYDEPNCDFLTLEQKNKFRDKKNGIGDFITYIYFNKSYPENHTVLFTNYKSSYCKIFKNNKWLIEYNNIVINNIYNIYKITTKLDNKIDNNEIDNNLDFEIKSNIIKTLYNNKDIVSKTKNKLDKKSRN
jgi:hypothetical protein